MLGLYVFLVVVDRGKTKRAAGFTYRSFETSLDCRIYFNCAPPPDITNA